MCPERSIRKTGPAAVISDGNCITEGRRICKINWLKQEVFYGKMGRFGNCKYSKGMYDPGNEGGKELRALCHCGKKIEVSK